MRRLVHGVGALALTVAAFVGCGGGDGDDSTAAAPVETEAVAALSKEELIAQGDAICAEVNAAVGTVGSTSTGSDGQTTQVADLYGGMVERLKELGVPSDDSSGYDEFIGAAEQLTQAQSDVALAAERGEGEALASAETEASSALSSFQSAASAYGLEQCAEAPSAPIPGSTPAGEGSEESAEGVEEEVAPEVEEEAEEVAPETGGAGAAEEESAGGGAGAGAAGGSEGSSGGGSSGGVGPG